MAIRASVEGLPEPGHAILRVSDLDAAPEGLAISIQRQQGPDSHLADDGWRRTEAWLLPERVERKRDVMEFHLGPEICDRLAGIATVRLRVKEPDIGVVATTVIATSTMAAISQPAALERRDGPGSSAREARSSGRGGGNGGGSSGSGSGSGAGSAGGGASARCRRTVSS